MKPSEQASARRFARATLDVALQKKTDAAVRDGLEAVAAVLGAHPDLREALTHPTVGTEDKKKVLAGLFPEGRVDPLVGRLLAMLADRDRLALLPAIALTYRRLWNERAHIVSAEAVTAAELTAPEQEALRAALARVTGTRVEMTARVDPALLGGVLVRMGGKVYDGSVRGRLAALRQQLAGRT